MTPSDFISASVRGGVELIHGDCLEEMKKIADGSVDLVLTDPMYDISQEQKEIFHKEFLRVSCGVILFMPPENQWLPADQYLFWIKPISTKNTSRKYSRFVEMIHLYGKLKWNAKRHWSQYTNVFTDLVEKETTHPFEKPYSLMKRLILNHTDAGDTILDPFMGSGTTGVACKNLNRNFIGIELDKDYFEIAQKRIDGQTLLGALRGSTI